jgi:hypothetical protein
VEIEKSKDQIQKAENKKKKLKSAMKQGLKDKISKDVDLDKMNSEVFFFFWNFLFWDFRSFRGIQLSPVNPKKLAVTGKF